MIQTEKVSSKRMIHSFSKTKDIKQVVFSHNQQLMAVSDIAGESIKLWDVQNQTQLYSFSSLANHPTAKNIQNPHHVSFTPDDRIIIILGDKSIHVFNISGLTQNSQNVSNFNATGQEFQLKRAIQIYRIQGSTLLGTGATSLDNIYYFYTNGSEVQIRDLSNFQPLYHYIDKSHYNQQQKDVLCDPYFLKKSIYQRNTFYTASILSGNVCKWVLKTNNERNIESVRFYPILSRKFNSTVNEIDQTKDSIIISFNRRQVLAINKSNFQVLGQNRLLNFDDFLDINQQAISEYSHQKNIIISGVERGSYIFFLNGSTLETISRIKLTFNTYAIQYNQKYNFIAVGTQQRVALGNGTQNIYDQVIFQGVKLNCGLIQNTKQFFIANNSTAYFQQCSCIDGYAWNRIIHKCQKLDCLIQETNKNACSCIQKYVTINGEQKKFIWNSYIRDCQLQCKNLNHSFSRASMTLDKQEELKSCPCNSGYRWNSVKLECQEISCRNMQGSTGRLNKTLNMKTCECSDRFVTSQRLILQAKQSLFQNHCMLNCPALENTNNKQAFFSDSYKKQVCQCGQNYNWNQTSYQCILKPFEPKSLQVEQGGSPVVTIVLIVLVIFFILLGVIIFCCYRQWKNKKSKYDVESDTDTIGTNNDVRSSKSINKNSTNRKINKEELNLAINNEIVRNYEPTFNTVSDEPRKALSSQTKFIQGPIKTISKQQQIDRSNSAVKKVRKRKLNSLQQQKYKADQLVNEIQDFDIEMESSRPLSKQTSKQRNKQVLIKETDEQIQQQSSLKQPNIVQRDNRMHNSKGKTCQICYQKGSDSLTRCNHYFHYACIQKQLQQDSSLAKQCPSCWIVLYNGMEDIIKLKRQQQSQKEQFAE